MSGRRGEGAREGSVTIELVEGRAVLVRDEEATGLGVDHEALGIQGASEHVRGRRGETVEVQGTGGVGELHGLDDLEVRDSARARIDVDGELLYPRVVGQRATACPAVAEPPPLVAIGIVVEVGEHAQALVERGGIAGQVGRVGGDGDAVHEGGSGEGRNVPAEHEGDDGGHESKAHDVLPLGVVRDEFCAPPSTSRG
jgi:hypothetical protein